MVKKEYLVLVLFTVVQLTSARGQKPGQMNEYDPETNTVYDESPDDSWFHWFTDLIFTEEAKQKRFGRNHGSINESDKHGSLWEDLKYGAKVVFVVVVLVALAIAGYFGRRWYIKRQEAQRRRWFQWNRQVDEQEPSYISQAMSGFRKAVQTQPAEQKGRSVSEQRPNTQTHTRAATAMTGNTNASAVDLEGGEEKKYETEQAEKKPLGKRLGGYFKSDKRWFNKVLKSNRSNESTQ